jgi:hypothetical protein
VSQQPKGIKCSERLLSNKSHLWKIRLERAHRAVEMRNEFMRQRTKALGRGWKKDPKKKKKKKKKKNQK